MLSYSSNYCILLLLLCLHCCCRCVCCCCCCAALFLTVAALRRSNTSILPCSVETCLTLHAPYFRAPDCMHLSGNTVLELSLTLDMISLRCRHAGWSKRYSVNPHGGSIASNNKVFTSARFDLLNGRDTTVRESHVT